MSDPYEQFPSHRPMPHPSSVNANFAYGDATLEAEIASYRAELAALREERAALLRDKERASLLNAARLHQIANLLLKAADGVRLRDPEAARRDADYLYALADAAMREETEHG